MKTYNISCADAAVGNSNAKYPRYDGMYNNVASCAYIRPTYLSSRYDSYSDTDKGLYSGWTHIALAFRQEDMSFLESKKILGITMWIYVISATPANHSLIAMCPTGASFISGATSGACSFNSANGAEILSVLDPGKMTGWKGFGIGSLAMLKNVIKRGVKVEDTGAGSAAVAYFSAYTQGSASYAPFIEVRYEDEFTPPVCQGLEPAANVVNGDESVTFKWSYQQAANAPQTHVSIKIKKPGQSWQNIVTKQAQSGQTYTQEAGLGIEGECQWQVQVFCTDGAVESAFSEIKSFLALASPGMPAITGADGTPKCTVSWQQNLQTGFEVWLCQAADEEVLYKSGQRLSTLRQFCFPFLLKDGNYTVKVRSLNAQGRWGPFAKTGISVKNAPTGQIAATAAAQSSGVIKICWQADKAFESYQILKNGQLFAELESGQTSCVDRFALGLCRYVVRGILGKNYTDSAVCASTFWVEYALIGGLKSGDFVPLEMRKDAPPLHRQIKVANCQMVQYENTVCP